MQALVACSTLWSAERLPKSARQYGKTTYPGAGCGGHDGDFECCRPRGTRPANRCAEEWKMINDHDARDAWRRAQKQNHVDRAEQAAYSELFPITRMNFIAHYGYANSRRRP